MTAVFAIPWVEKFVDAQNRQESMNKKKVIHSTFNWFNINWEQIEIKENSSGLFLNVGWFFFDDFKFLFGAFSFLVRFHSWFVYFQSKDETSGSIQHTAEHRH